ncbi:hypothetical protein LJF28_04860 [Chryseobacterium indologenes]|uniref:hypothetical protein n=1 Tax=Chryseobacterium indologenes TaxID=253 RepID=UPI001D0CF296|nr:hypothetical protein [Chryseobacterium indologenes]UDQ55000.1 hypothetical protein LJF28_04860 [Chryseobacterium indologenes]
MSKNNKNAVEFFKTNPNVKEVFATTDGFVFVKKVDATNHAKTLNPDSPVVETIGNEQDQPADDKKENTGKKLTPAEQKAFKEKATEEYTQLFGVAPEGNLSGPKIQELIDAKKADLAKASDNEKN